MKTQRLHAIAYEAFNPNNLHILLYNFLVTHPNFIKFGDFS